jgi:hypothetical protein
MRERRLNWYGCRQCTVDLWRLLLRSVHCALEVRWLVLVLLRCRGDQEPGGLRPEHRLIEAHHCLLKSQQLGRARVAILRRRRVGQRFSAPRQVAYLYSGPRDRHATSVRCRLSEDDDACAPRQPTKSPYFPFIAANGEISMSNIIWMDLIGRLGSPALTSNTGYNAAPSLITRTLFQVKKTTPKRELALTQRSAGAIQRHASNRT